MIRIDERTGLGVALSVDGNGRYARLDPYNGAKLALAEAYRNVAVTGAKPIAVTNCLNFGSPGGPGRDVAVRRGRPRPGRRLPGAGHPGHRRQRQLLQPDRRGGRSTRPRWSACSACSTTSPTGCRWASPRADGDAIALLLGETARGAVRLGVGLGDARAPRRPAAAGRPGRASSALADAAGRGGRARAPQPRRTTSPTAAWPRRWSSPACGAASAPGSRCRSDVEPVRRTCSASPPARALVVGAARPREGVRRALRRARRAVSTLIGVTDRPSRRARGARPVPDRPGRAARRAHRDAAAPLRGRGGRRGARAGRRCGGCGRGRAAGRSRRGRGRVDAAGRVGLRADRVDAVPVPARPARSSRVGSGAARAEDADVAEPPVSPSRRLTSAEALTAAVYGQPGSGARFDWGLTGAAELGRVCAVLVVVDVLSFTTAVDVAVGRGMRVHPFPWGEQAAAYADRVGAAVAVGRRQIDARSSPWSLSPGRAEQRTGGRGPGAALARTARRSARPPAPPGYRWSRPACATRPPSARWLRPARGTARRTPRSA